MSFKRKYYRRQSGDLHWTWEFTYEPSKEVMPTAEPLERDESASAVTGGPAEPAEDTSGEEEEKS